MLLTDLGHWNQTTAGPVLAYHLKNSAVIAWPGQHPVCKPLDRPAVRTWHPIWSTSVNVGTFILSLSVWSSFCYLICCWCQTLDIEGFWFWLHCFLPIDLTFVMPPIPDWLPFNINLHVQMNSLCLYLPKSLCPNAICDCCPVFWFFLFLHLCHRFTTDTVAPLCP